MRRYLPSELDGWLQGRGILRIFEVHFSVKLVATDVLDGLQDALARLSPGFCADLRVMSYERDRDVRRVVPGLPLRQAVVAKGLQRGETYRSLVQESGPPSHDREFGDVIVRGLAPRTNLYIRFDDLTPAKPIGENWLFSNSIAGQVGPAKLRSSANDLRLRTGHSAGEHVGHSLGRGS